MMKFLRKTRNAIRSYFNRLKYFKLINKCDDITNNHLQNSKNYLHLDGYKISKGKISQELLNKFQKFFDNNKIFIPEIIDLFQFVNDEFNEIIKGYFKQDFLLCYLGIQNINTKNFEKGISEGWHTDSVGHKINLFLCLEGDGKIPTLFIPKTHKKIYTPNILEDLRIIKKNISWKNHEIKIDHTTGDCNIFDSNGLHRADYSAKNSIRKVIMLNFINKNKFFHLTDLVKNTIKTKLPYRLENLYEHNKIPYVLLPKLLSFDFFCKRTVIKKNENYFYPFCNIKIN